MAKLILSDTGQIGHNNRLDHNKKHVAMGNTKVYPDLIYARVIGLIVSSQEIDFYEVLAVLAYELAAYPPSTDSDGEMKISKSKSV